MPNGKRVAGMGMSAFLTAGGQALPTANGRQVENLSHQEGGTAGVRLTGQCRGGRVVSADLGQNDTDLAGIRSSALCAPALRHPAYWVAEGGRVWFGG